MKNKEIKQILGANVFENKKYPGGKFVTLNVLTYPELTDKNFDKINPKDYVWEERQFAHPMFKNREKGEVFALEIKITDNSSIITGIDEPEMMLNKTIRAFSKFQDNYNKFIKKIKKSKIFNTKLNKTIKL